MAEAVTGGWRCARCGGQYPFGVHHTCAPLDYRPTDSLVAARIEQLTKQRDELQARLAPMHTALERADAMEAAAERVLRQPSSKDAVSMYLDARDDYLAARTAIAQVRGEGDGS